MVVLARKLIGSMATSKLSPKDLKRNQILPPRTSKDRTLQPIQRDVNNIKIRPLCCRFCFVSSYLFDHALFSELPKTSMEQQFGRITLP
jgi:hypothetical protein